MRKRLHIAVFFALMFCFGKTITSQQEWLYSQSAFNLYDANAAFAGSYEELSFAFRTRYQWVGIEGAPKSNLLSVHLPAFQNVGTGIRIQQEEIGARTRWSAKGTFSYHLPLKNGYFGVAFNGGVITQQFDKNILVSKNEIENLLIHDENAMSVVIDFAALWFSEKYYLGFEMQNINEPSFYPNEFIQLKQRRFLHLHGAYAFEIGSKHLLRPTFSLRNSFTEQWSAEGVLSMFIDKKIWIGTGYRNDFGWLALAEWNISDAFRIGYSYDHNVEQLGLLATSSHEIFIGLHVQTGKKKSSSIRYFK